MFIFNSIILPWPVYKMIPWIDIVGGLGIIILAHNPFALVFAIFTIAYASVVIGRRA